MVFGHIKIPFGIEIEIIGVLITLTTLYMTQPFDVLPKQNIPFFISSFEQLHENIIEVKKQSSNYYQLVWIQQGSANCQLDLHTITIKNSQLYFIRPGQHHNIFETDGLNGCIISFTGSFLELEDAQMDVTSYTTLFQILNHAEGIALPPGLVTELQVITERMQNEYGSNYPLSTEILRRYLKIFFLYLTRHFENHYEVIHQTRNMELVQKFLSLLNMKFKTQKMVAAYARELYVTPNYLNEVIKKNTGFPAGYHIRQRIVLEAKRLAKYSNMCMKQIADSLDFADSAHFSKFFKTVTGSNFSDYKKEKLTLTTAS